MAAWWRVAAVTAVVSWPLVVAAPASASSLSGCSGTVTSYDAAGRVLDAASARDGVLTDERDGGQAFTADNPFVVDHGGSVVYQGTSDAVITDHHWKLTLLGVPVATGGSANASRTTSADGRFEFGAYSPIAFTGLIRVAGRVSGQGGSCTGDGFIQVQGDPATSPVVLLGGASLLAGIACLFWSLPRAGTVAPVEGSPA